MQQNIESSLMWFQIQHCNLNLRNYHLESRLAGWSRGIVPASGVRGPGFRSQMSPCILGLSWWLTQMVKNPPTMQETWVLSLVWEDPLEKGMATHSSILAWRIPMEKGAWQLQSIVSQRVGHDWETKQHSSQHPSKNIHNYMKRSFLFQLSICVRPDFPHMLQLR